MRLPFSNPRQAAEAKISKALIPSMKKEALQIATLLEKEVTRVTDGVFREAVPLIGEDVDLASQLPILGLAHWRPLSLDYVKRKGAIAFFVYSSLLSGGKQRRSAHDILHGSGHSDPFASTLADTLGSLSGTRVFGPASVEVLDWRKMPVSAAPTPIPPDWRQVRFFLVIKPWGKLGKADLPRLERWLAAQGAISNETRIKLSNPAGTMRPFLRPWLAWFSDVIIPGAILAALRTKYRTVEITQVRPFDPGPF